MKQITKCQHLTSGLAQEEQNSRGKSCADLNFYRPHESLLSPFLPLSRFPELIQMKLVLIRENSWIIICENQCYSRHLRSINHQKS